MKHYCSLLFILIFTSTFLYSQANDTLRTESGLKYYYLEKGSGEQAQDGWVMITHYTGSFLDGKLFDSSRERDQPFVFTLNRDQVIKGMDEGVSLLNIGDRVVLIIPSDLAYGEKGAGEVIPPHSVLVFDVELLDTKEKSLNGVLEEALYGKEEAKRDTALYFKAMYKSFKKLKKKNFKNLYYSESDLNRLGYTVMEKYPQEALEIFKMNVELFPESFNVYDSLGEAYLLVGNTEEAIVNYEKSVAINPENENGVEVLKKLK